MAWPKEEDCTSYKPLENYPYNPPLKAPITSFTWADTTTDSSSAARLLGQYTLKPSPVLGAASSIRCTDEEVGKIQDYWWTEIVNKRAKELREDIERQLIYGTGPIAKGIMKEKEMEIGGNKCHLCGMEMTYNKTEVFLKKKRNRVELHKVYACGTQMYETYRECVETGAREDFDRHIHAECV